MIDKVKTSEMSEAQLLHTSGDPLGLGHAIWCAKKLIGDEPFAIILPDDVIHWERGCLHR